MSIDNYEAIDGDIFISYLYPNNNRVCVDLGIHSLRYHGIWL